MKIPEKIHILGFSKRKYEGDKAAIEVTRIGKTPDIFWNVLSDWDFFCVENTKTIAQGYIKNRTDVFSATRGHHHMIRAALDMGEDSFWGIEPDCRFLKNIDEFHDRISKAPKDADILLLDFVYADPLQNMEKCHKSALNSIDGWWKIHDEDVRNMADYILSHRAMEKLCTTLSRGSVGKRFWCCDSYWKPCWFSEFQDFNIYVAYPPLSVQAVDPLGGHISSYRKTNGKYMFANVNFDNYAEF